MSKKLIAALALMGISSFSNAACSLSDITLTSVKTKFVSRCSAEDCIVLQGAAMIENKCSEAVGVQMQIIGLDQDGAAVTVDEFWPASIRNIPPGSYSFSLDQHLKYDPSIVKIELKVVNVEHWN
ncbi:hypothetical protein DXU77_05695 [Pseudomonas lactis]|uniref:hypothetical protein n=1 Tax=Pseudomonas lactis TaxID=1615674 RepID=UPI0012950CB2|nr:hypothetical protein [Pseudomonas lactis]MQB14603.1 hypothetical protein [Pseudomonas lactis]